MAPHSERLHELDSLRGIAALVVVLHHALLVIPDFAALIDGKRPAPHGIAETLLFLPPLRILWNGHGAVLLFFVLSGFVLSLPWSRGKPLAYADFAIRRVFRIYVPYLAVVGVVAALVAAGGFPTIPALSPWFNAAWREPISPALIGDHLLMLGQHNTIDTPIWSLVWEMRVSLLLPLIVLPMVRWGTWGSALTPVGIFAAYAVLHATGWQSSGDFAPVETLFFAVAFALGAALAFQRHTVWAFVRARRLGPPLLIIGLALLIEPWPLKRQLADLIAMVGALAVITGCVTALGPRKALLAPIPQWLGKISYSLYLVHVPVILLLVHLLSGAVPLVVILPLAIAASLILAAVTQRWIEAPSDALGKALIQRRVATRAGLAEIT